MNEIEEVFCTDCGAVIPGDAGFCPECGAEQVHVNREDAVDREGGDPLAFDEEYCGDCGKVIPADVPYCPNCGGDQSTNGDTSDAEEANGASAWLVGFVPGSTMRNVVVGLLYVFCYPVGIPLVIYSYFTGKRGWSKRKTGITFMSILVLTLVALAAIGMTVDPVPEGANTADAADPTTAVPEATQPANGGQERSVDVAIRIEYGESWSGAASILYDGDSQTQSISGYGTQTLDVEGDPEQVCANAQKQDDGSARLVVQIIHDGDVVSQSSTNSAYGVAQTCADVSDFF